MEAEKVQQLIQGIDSLYLTQFTALAEKAKGGAVLSDKEIKTLEHLRRKLTDQLPVDEGKQIESELRARGVAAELFRFVPASKAAKLIGSTSQSIKNLCHPKDESQPKLPHKTRGQRGDHMVQPALAYHFAAKYLRSNKLVPPQGWIGEKASAPAADQERLSEDLHASLLEIVTNPEKMASYGVEQLNVLKGIAQELRVKAAEEAKLKKRLLPDQVVKMLSSHYDVFATIIEERTGGRAKEFAKMIRERFGVDVLAQSPAAIAEIEDCLRDQANQDLAAVRAEVDEQTKGLRLMEMGDPA